MLAARSLDRQAIHLQGPLAGAPVDPTRHTELSRPWSSGAVRWPGLVRSDVRDLLGGERGLAGSSERNPRWSSRSLREVVADELGQRAAAVRGNEGRGRALLRVILS